MDETPILESLAVEVLDIPEVMAIPERPEVLTIPASPVMITIPQ